ncbi:MAG: polyamine aminopropyltransferase [Candidatus Tectomicrobia bacterium]|uniref:Polyamine aminopropyltransferase n=1 Tax=Tectimicrobiota bacterium TaxID=2528274 RepID=A0A932MLQ6_UNCTE|nr:polyamine aminopropyltransferase [Candidatus Tectomicrobia bacterium]
MKKEPSASLGVLHQGEFWFTELHAPGTGITFRVKRVLHWARTPFQELALVETEDMGRALFLDGTVQFTERDEFFYHEMLVHVPLSIHPRPRRVLIVGGGDGGCVREALLHPGVAEVTLVEIDGEVVEACREHIPSVSSKLGDPRVRVLIQDGVKFMKDNRGSFDVIIVDSTDPVGMASPLTQAPFFRTAMNALTSEGLYVAQSQGPVFDGKEIGRIARAARKVFRHAAHFMGPTPTYPGGHWTYLIGARGAKHPAGLKPRPLPRGTKTRYYSPEIHTAAFVLPPFVRDFIR